MKRAIFLLIVFWACSGNVISKEWTFIEDFVTVEGKYEARPHGVVVTPDGKIWVGFYGFSDVLIDSHGDSIFINPVWIFNPDGSVHDKIKFLTYNAQTDTIFNYCRGLSLDNNGNVLLSSWDTLWRINYQTYQAMNRTLPHEDTAITEAACDQNGFIYLTFVVPDGKPFYIFDKNFSLVNYVQEKVHTIQRP